MDSPILSDSYALKHIHMFNNSLYNINTESSKTEENHSTHIPQTLPKLEYSYGS